MESSIDVIKSLISPRSRGVISLPLVAGSDSLPSQALFSPVHTKTACGQNLALAAWQYHMQPHGRRARSGAHHRVSQTEGAKGDECTHAQREAKSRTSTAATE